MLTWEPAYYEGYTTGNLPGSWYWALYESYQVTSDRSFVDVAKSKGVTNHDIFTTCSWPTYTVSSTVGGFGPTTTGYKWAVATTKMRECVVEKLVNKYAESGWTLLTPPGTSFASFNDYERSYWFIRQNATSS